MSTILLTGGAGFIGSHTAVELLNAGYDVIIVDNLCNSSRESVRRVEEITGRTVTFYQADCTSRDALNTVFSAHPIDAVIHFAGLKAVGESVAQPIRYYRNNLDSTLILLEVMKEHDVHSLVFSSSATVYGVPEKVPMDETMPTSCTNPYGWTKLMSEQIMADAVTADPTLSILLLRYFNPIGAHESGRIGEAPNGIPNNLMPYIAQVAAGKRDHLNVFGDDYDTPDGTGVRDYIHVVDLAKGHVKAVAYAMQHTGIDVVNLGTGHGYSVLDIVKAFEKANGLHIPYEIAPRRPGDIATSFANPDKAQRLLGWTAEKTLEDMCRDTWRWQSANPNGYDMP